MTAEDPRVTDDPAHDRLVVREGGEEAELVYRRRADRLILTHTRVPESIGGRGIGGLLVKAAVDWAARDGLTLVPWCPYARKWLETHDAAGVMVDWTPPGG